MLTKIITEFLRCILPERREKKARVQVVKYQHYALFKIQRIRPCLATEFYVPVYQGSISVDKTLHVVDVPYHPENSMSSVPVRWQLLVIVRKFQDVHIQSGGFEPPRFHISVSRNQNSSSSSSSSSNIMFNLPKHLLSDSPERMP